MITDKELTERIRARLAELNRSPITAAVAGGLERSYLRDLLNGKKRSVKREAHAGIAKGLDWTEAELRNEVAHPFVPRTEGTAQDVNNPAPAVVPLPPSGASLLRAAPAQQSDGEMPLYRFAHAGRGTLILEEIPFETVARPDYLARVREPYGVMVEGDSMEPEFNAGWVVEVNPNLTPRKDDACVFRGVAVDGGYWAAVKKYVREDETHWHVRQHNPRKSYKLKKAEFQTAHVVVGTDRRRR